MKRILLAITLFILTGLGASAAGVERIKPHPRLLADSHAITKLSKDVSKAKNENLMMMHAALLQAAERAITQEKYKESLYVAAEATSSCIYAYKVLGEKCYKERAVEVVSYLCEMPDWHPEHFLGVTSASFACSLYYDWLYDEIPASLRRKILDALQSKVLDASADPRYAPFLNKVNNWNQVCNAGVVLAAICLWDDNPDAAQEAITAAINRNRPVAEKMFAPDGIYPEGPGYTSFGGGWQLAMISALRSAFGSDFGLLSSPGMDCLGDFLMATTGPTGLAFDYSDNTERDAAPPILWKLADEYGKPYYLYQNGILGNDYIERGLNSGGSLLLMYALSADRIGGKRIPEPPSLMFSGSGSQPLCTVRSGWEKDAMYLAVKGGNPALGHSHLDVGSFVFDAHGLRWAQEVKGRSYKFYERNLVDRRRLWRKTPDSPRWRLFRYNNRQHNTITINNKDHAVTGYAPIIKVIDEGGRRGASFDLNNAFQGMTMSVIRSAVLVNGKYLEITDDIHASEDDVCEVMWNMATPAKAELLPDGILLSQGPYRMKLSSESQRIKWFVETAAERAQKTAFEPWDAPVGDSMFCGYTLTVNKSERVVITVTLKDEE